MTTPCDRHACAECCWDTEMPLTEEDVARLASLGHDINSFSRVGEDRMLQLRTRDEPRGDGKRPCHFLRDGRCSVYEARPAGCRTYPFVLTTDGKVVRDEDCPHAREFPRDPATGRRLLRIAVALRREAERRPRP